MSSAGFERLRHCIAGRGDAVPPIRGVLAGHGQSNADEINFK